ncbi:MAG: hypothetical protein BWX88_04968 [Planctomycetes bacterium ADurb.Bin126]|nr:MAG: hypothetical protein BWX88_04968 [Planctomycetes bacterium ADurb.Bin126]
MITQAATSYLRAGLCVLPAILDEKRPAVGSWKAYQQCLPAEAQIAQWFSTATACCLLTGSVSGNLEMIDFDAGGALFDRWAALVEEQAPGLLARLVIERSRRGGRHVVYRCRSAVCGNLKLAQRQVKDGRPETLIETRGEGGLFLCAPSPGYEVIQGDLAVPSVIEDAERDVLLSAAWSLNQCWKRQDSSPMVAAVAGRPGDDFNDRGDVRDLLVRHGWTLARSGENEYWRRPGKDCGSSATLKDRVFYVFSSNAAPFEPQRAYAPFGVYALLEHGGDYAAAAAMLRAKGFGQPPDVTGVDLSAFTTVATDDDPPDSTVPDPGPMPDELLRIPGFISEVMDYTLATAPYPNTVLAFAGALALQAFLAGRKVRDPADNRTNLYLLGLAHSAAGKDHPRKVNTRIIHAAGLSECLGDKFASGEGVQDALFVTPCMLFQTDEIDGMLQSINKARDARHESIMGTLLTMYSSANSVFPMRRKAGKQAAGVIDQPNLVIFGTAIPNHYYEALSERMLTNGFFARMIILEGAARAEGQEPRIAEIPQDVLATAKWWAEFRPGPGNLQRWHPEPATVEQSDGAKAAVVEARRESEAQYRKAEAVNDSVGTTVWGRVSEQVRKLSLLYAVSENHRTPIITEAAARWASRFVLHQTRRMLFMASRHVADSPFEAECLKLLTRLREAPGRQLLHSVLLKRMKIESKRFIEIISTLEQRREVEVVSVQTAGRTGAAYRLRSPRRCVSEGKEGVKHD